MCSRWYIQGRGRNRFQVGACRRRCGGRQGRDQFFVFSKGLGECILLTLSNSTSSIAASDPTNCAPFSLLCLPQQNNPTPCSKISLQFKVQTLLALEVEVKSCKWERVSHVPLPVPSTCCASVLFTIETAWLTGKQLERVSCFVFGLLVGWALSRGSIGLKMILSIC